MKIEALALLVGALGILPAAGGIDFTPTTTERTQAGIKFTELNFKENGRRIVYEQPRGWSYTGGGAGIRFTPPGLTQAQAEIDQVPLAAPQPIDAEVMKALQQKTLAAVPQGSLNVALVSDAANPVVLNKNPTYEVIVAYQAFGQDFMMGLLYLHLPDTQVRFRTIARKDDFEKVHAAFRSSLFSWQWK